MPGLGFADRCSLTLPQRSATSRQEQTHPAAAIVPESVRFALQRSNAWSGDDRAMQWPPAQSGAD
jgi:hypothetical protein